MENKKNPSTKLKANVWWLSATSFFTDISSEMIFPILPIFLRNVLGASFSMIGVIEGVAEGLASLLKYFSGYISDVIHKRRGLTFLGYSLSALSKLFFALAASPLTILFFRSLDRIGKGIRTSPRDALIAESVSSEEQGKYFGLHRASDTVGAVIGTLIAVFLLYYLQSFSGLGSGIGVASIRLILFLSFIPALIGLLGLLFVKEVGDVNRARSFSSKSGKLFQFGKFSKKFQYFLLIAGLFGFANYSYSFYILRANELGVKLFLIPIIYLTYNVFYAISVYPSGAFSDKVGRVPVLLSAFILFALLSIGFAYTSEKIFLWVLFALYGLFIGLTDGVLKAFVSDLALKESRGEAFGIYYTIIGFTTIAGNISAGLIWQNYGSYWAFMLSGGLILVAGFLLWFKFTNHNGSQTSKSIQDFKAYRG